MADYQAPLRDMRFMLNEVLDAAQLNKLPGLTAATPDVIDAVLEEAGKMTAGAMPTRIQAKRSRAPSPVSPSTSPAIEATPIAIGQRNTVAVL